MTRTVARWMLGKAKAELRVRRKDHKETCRLWRIYVARNRALLALSRNPIWYQEAGCWREMVTQRRLLRQLREVVRDLRRVT